MRQRYIGWGYAKGLIREYGVHIKSPHKSRLKPYQERAIQQAVEHTKTLVDGAERLKLIDLVFWKQTHSLQGACLVCYVSERTGRQWHTDFIRLVCVNLDLS